MIDHRAEATALALSNGSEHGDQGFGQMTDALRAQVHATLYLAEQQSTANQIALLSNAERAVAEGRLHVDDYTTLFRQLNPRIMKAMGLGKEASDG